MRKQLNKVVSALIAMCMMLSLGVVDAQAAVDKLKIEYVDEGVTITSDAKCPVIDWSGWAEQEKSKGYYGYKISVFNEEEMAGYDPYDKKSYFRDGIFLSKDTVSYEMSYLQPGTTYYVCIMGDYYDYSECVDYSAGKLEAGAVFAKFTTAAEKKTVKLNKSKATLKVGKKTTVKLSGVDLSKQSFKSSNTKVAKVSKKGVVTGVKAGKCNIVVTDKNTKKKYICKVTVQNRNEK